MRKVGYTVILSLVMLSTIVSYAYSTFGDLVTTAWPLNNPLEDGEFPIIVGNVKDQGGNPVSGVQVKISFATETITSTTNNVGSFYIELKTPAQPGDYTVNVISTKEGYGMNVISTSYFVNGIPPTIPGFDLTTINQFPLLIEEGLTKNPLSQIILQHMEKVKKQQDEAEKKQLEIENRKNFLDEQRQISQNVLKEDLLSFEKESEFNTPRLAFDRFVQSVDETVQVIFWGQFNLTEKQHNEAYAAKQTAIENGETSVNAMKIFQRKAAITKNEIVDYNSELNIKYGFADESSQSYFDNDGKLRWGKNSAENKTVFWYLNPDG
ncbi:MAG: carboxypeptidase-like regulatory domain-containing protein [Nitrosopumilaceae archaeon]